MPIVWEEPPEAATRANAGSEVAASLRARPGEWAVVSDLCKTTAYGISNGGTKAWRPAGHFEAVTRMTQDGRKVYARYVGGESA